MLLMTSNLQNPFSYYLGKFRDNSGGDAIEILKFNYLTLTSAPEWSLTLKQSTPLLNNEAVFGMFFD